MGMKGEIGTLAPGAAGDLTILRVDETPYTFVDSYGKERCGDLRLVPSRVIKAGREIPAVVRG